MTAHVDLLLKMLDGSDMRIAETAKRPTRSEGDNNAERFPAVCFKRESFDGIFGLIRDIGEETATYLRLLTPSRKVPNAPKVVP